MPEATGINVQGLAGKPWAEMSAEERQQFILTVAMQDPSYLAARANKSAVDAAEKQAREAAAKLATEARDKLSGELAPRLRGIINDTVAGNMLGVGLVGFTIEVTPGVAGGPVGVNVRPVVKSGAKATSTGEPGKVAPKAQLFLGLTGRAPGEYFDTEAPQEARDYYRALAGMGAEQDSFKRAIIIPLAESKGDLAKDHGLAYNKSMAQSWAEKGVKGQFSRDLSFESLAKRAAALRAEKAAKQG